MKESESLFLQEQRNKNNYWQLLELEVRMNIYSIHE